MGELEGTTAAVWGDANGVAAAIGAALASAGADVIADSGDQQVGAFLETAAQRLGGLDLTVICISTAGPSQPLVETSDERWQRTLDDHLGVAFRGVRGALAQMLPRGRGRVLVTASVESKVPRSGATPYVAAQHGIAGLVKSVAHEVGPQGILVNGLLCGLIEGGHDSHGDEAAEGALIAQGAIKRRNTPQEIAAAAVVLASPRLSSITGTLFPVHGGIVPY